MKTNLFIASSILAMLFLSVSCDKNNSSPSPSPEPQVITYTVTVTNDFVTGQNRYGDTETCKKMLDVYVEKGFIDGYSVRYVDAIILEKTGVPASDTAKVRKSLCEELSKKLKTAAEEIAKTDWTKVFGTDDFQLGKIDLTAVLPGGEKVNALSLCTIPSILFDTEYKSTDPDQPLQKFTVSQENIGGLLYKAKVTIKDKGEYEFLAKYSAKGYFRLGFPDLSSPVQHTYIFRFNKTTDGKEMTLRERVIDKKHETVSVVYKAD